MTVMSWHLFTEDGSSKIKIIFQLSLHQPTNTVPNKDMHINQFCPPPPIKHSSHYFIDIYIIRHKDYNDNDDDGHYIILSKSYIQIYYSSRFIWFWRASTADVVYFSTL
jgi:hypothetical protein